MTASRQLAEFATACREGLPAGVAADVPGRVLDIIGLMLAAQGDPAAEAVTRAVMRWGGTAEATAFGLPERIPAPAAALVNGTLAHALDFKPYPSNHFTHPGINCALALRARGLDPAEV